MQLPKKQHRRANAGARMPSGKRRNGRTGEGDRRVTQSGLYLTNAVIEVKVLGNATKTKHGGVEMYLSRGGTNSNGAAWHVQNTGGWLRRSGQVGRHLLSHVAMPCPERNSCRGTPGGGTETGGTNGKDRRRRVHMGRSGCWKLLTGKHGPYGEVKYGGPGPAKLPIGRHGAKRSRSIPFQTCRVLGIYQVRPAGKKKLALGYGLARSR